MSKMGLHGPFGHLQHKLWQKEGSKIKLAIWLPTIKSWESTQSRCVQAECNTPWKALEESYKFVSNLISIGGLSKKLWPRKVPGVQTGTVSGLFLGSPKIKSHSDVNAAERHIIYYMGEGGGFPWVRAMVSLMSPKLPVACPSIKGVP